MNHSRPFSWQNPKLEIRDTGRYGRGVFCRDDICCGETLFVIGGQILTNVEEQSLPTNLFDKPFEIADQFSIGPKSSEDLEMVAHWSLNHGCDANAGFLGQIILAALRPIEQDAEIVCDYAMCLRPGDPFMFECLCGSPLCRHVVTSEDWKLPELQRRYHGYFQWYLQEKINRLRASG